MRNRQNGAERKVPAEADCRIQPNEQQGCRNQNNRLQYKRRRKLRADKIRFYNRNHIFAESAAQA